jgi:hypothetical protein
MAKPAITKRSVKAAALTYNELDTNFQNLQDATISLTAGTGGTQVISDLNGNITLVAGTGVTLTGNNTAKTITIDSAAGSNTFSTIVVDGTSVVADSNADTLVFNAGAGLDSVVDPSTDTITFNLASNQTIITTINPGSNALTLQSSAFGATLDFRNGVINASRYILKSAAVINNAAAAVVDISFGADILTLSTATALQNPVSSLTITVEEQGTLLNPLTSVLLQKMVFTTDTAGGTFDIQVREPGPGATVDAMWTDGIKTCDRDGTTYMLQIHMITADVGDNTIAHSKKYFIELLPYA